MVEEFIDDFHKLESSKIAFLKMSEKGLVSLFLVFGLHIDTEMYANAEWRLFIRIALDQFLGLVVSIHVQKDLRLDEFEKLIFGVLVKTFLACCHSFFSIAVIQQIVDDLRDVVGAVVADLIVGQVEHVLIVGAAFLLLHFINLSNE